MPIVPMSLSEIDDDASGEIHPTEGSEGYWVVRPPALFSLLPFISVASGRQIWPDAKKANNNTGKTLLADITLSSNPNGPPRVTTTGSGLVWSGLV